MDPTNSNGWAHSLHTTISKWQLSSDILIAFAYFSIPLELVYFIYRSKVFPFRWVIAQFGLFIVLCGTTHLLTLWSYFYNSTSSRICMTIAKVTTAAISCATTVVLLRVIPELLDVKKREQFLLAKTTELDLEVGKIKKEGETLRHVRFLTEEIRSSLDRNMILQTTLVEVSRILHLEGCNIWMPKMGGQVLELRYNLGSRVTPFEIPVVDESVTLVGENPRPVVVPDGSLLATLGCSCNHENNASRVAAVRLPLLSTASFNHSPTIEKTTFFAIMVLELPVDRLQWSKEELEVIEAVADQVVVALSHATVVEESIQSRDMLMEQNVALEKAKQEAELAVIARNEFLAVMNHEMRTPMHAIIALSSLLRQSNLASEQIHMIDTILKSSSILSTLINDVLDFSRLEAGSLSLNAQAFQLRGFLKEAEDLVTPMAQSKNLHLSMVIEGSIPSNVYADSNRILQVFLNVVGNSIKFTKEGFIKISVYVKDMETGSMPVEMMSPKKKFKPVFLHFDVQDTGIGIKATDLLRLFNKFVQADSSTTRNFGGSGLGLAISKEFVELMGGKIWLESEGLGKGSTCKFFVSLGVDTDLEPQLLISPRKPQKRTDLLGLRVIVVDDNSINRIVTRRLMETIGCVTTVLDSGQKCLQILTTAEPGSYDVLLLDLNMPEVRESTVI